MQYKYMQYKYKIQYKYCSFLERQKKSRVLKEFNELFEGALWGREFKWM